MIIKLQSYKDYRDGLITKEEMLRGVEGVSPDSHLPRWFRDEYNMREDKKIEEVIKERYPHLLPLRRYRDMTWQEIYDSLGEDNDD